MSSLALKLLKSVLPIKQIRGSWSIYPMTSPQKTFNSLYEELPGWKEDLTQITDLDDFPVNFKNYITYLENALETPIKIVSVGPDRKQTLFR